MSGDMIQCAQLWSVRLNMAKINFLTNQVFYIMITSAQFEHILSTIEHNIIRA